MRLDIKNQPLDFDIYLSQVIEVPRTPTLEVPPYNFKLELDALELVDRIIAREHLNEQRKEQNDSVAISNQHLPIQTSGGCNPTELIEQVNPPYYNDILSVPVTVASPSPLSCAINSQASSKAKVQQESSQIEPSAHEHRTIEEFVPLKPLIPPPTCPVEESLAPSKCFTNPEQEPSTSAAVLMNNSQTTQTVKSVDTDQLVIGTAEKKRSPISELDVNTLTDCDQNKSYKDSCFIDTSQLSQNEIRKPDKETDKDKVVNRINPREFEELHYNPFDHLELQTIDELRELNLVFQASFADQASKQ